MKYFIPLNVPSSKNSKRIVRNKGRTFLVWSKTAQRYKNETVIVWQSFARKFRDEAKGKEKPLVVHFKFFRDSRRKFDYPNALQTVLDLMVEFDWIDDDNADEILLRSQNP